VRIQLTKGDKHYQWISKKTRNDGRHTWVIPSSIAAGSQFKVKIKSVKKKKLFDASNRYFTIKNGNAGGGGGPTTLFTVNSTGVTCYHPEYADRDNAGTSRRQQCKWYCGNYQGKQRFVSITWKATDSNGYRWVKYSENIWGEPYSSSYCPSGEKGGIVGAQGGGNRLFSVNRSKGVTCYDADEEELRNTGHARTRMCKWYCGLYQGKKRFVLIRWKATDSNGFRWTKYSDNIWDEPYALSYCD